MSWRNGEKAVLYPKYVWTNKQLKVFVLLMNMSPVVPSAVWEWVKIQKEKRNGETAHRYDCGCLNGDKEVSSGVNMLKMRRQMGRQMNRERVKNAQTDSENDQVDRLEPSM